MSKGLSPRNGDAEGNNKKKRQRRNVNFSVRERVVPCSMFCVIPFFAQYLANTTAIPEFNDKPHDFIDEDWVQTFTTEWEVPTYAGLIPKIQQVAPQEDFVISQEEQPFRETANSPLYYSTPNAPLVEAPTPLMAQGMKAAPSPDSIIPTFEQPADPEMPTMPENTPPVANLDNPSYGTPNQSIGFDGTRSFDLDGTIVQYSFDFGDGNTYFESLDPITGEIFAPDGAFDGKTQYSYLDSGNFKTTLTVKDNTGATDTATNNITIGKNDNPIFLTPGDTNPKSAGIETPVLSDPEHTQDNPATVWIEGKLDAVKNTVDNPGTASIDENANSVDNIVQYGQNWTAIANAYDTDGSIKGYQFWIDVNKDGNYTGNEYVGASTTGEILVDHTKFALQAGKDYNMAVRAIDDDSKASFTNLLLPQKAEPGTAHSFDTFHVNQAPAFINPGDDPTKTPGVVDDPKIGDPGHTLKDNPLTPWVEGKLDAVLNDGSASTLNNIVQYKSDWTAIAKAYDNDGTIQGYDFWIKDNSGSFVSLGSSTTGLIGVDHTQFDFTAGSDYQMKVIATDNTGATSESFDTFHINEGPVFLTPGDSNPNSPGVETPSLTDPTNIKDILGTPWIEGSLDAVKNSADPNSLKNIVQEGSSWIAIANAFDPDGTVNNYQFWIDVNRDGDYNDPNEFVGASTTGDIKVDSSFSGFAALKAGEIFSMKAVATDDLGSQAQSFSSFTVSGSFSGGIDAVAVPSIQSDIDIINLGDNLDFGINVTTPNGIAATGAYTYSIDKAPAKTFNTEAELIASINAQGPSLTVGTHGLVVTVKDTLDNIAEFKDTIIVSGGISGAIDAVAVPSIQVDTDTINLGDTLNFGIFTSVQNGIAPTDAYTFSFDGAPVQTFDTEAELIAAINAVGPSLTAGSHSLIVTVKDTLGNIGNFADTVIVNAPFAGGIDAVAVPSIQSDIDTINLGDTLNFGINVTDANGIAPTGGYTFSFDGAPAQTFNTEADLITAINAAGPSLTAGTHSLIVTVKDTLGNIGNFADTVIVNAPFAGGIDNVTNAPTPGSGISYGSGPDAKAGTADDTFDIDTINLGDTLNFGINVTDANGIAPTGGYTFSFDGAPAQTFNTVGALTTAINAAGPSLTAGSHNLVVTVKDALGNIGTFNDTVIVNAPFTGGIDNVTNAPTPGSGISYGSGPDAKAGTADDTFDIDVINQGQNLNFGINVNDANGIAATGAYTASFDGKAAQTFDTIAALTASINAQGSLLSAGSHNLVVTVKDTLGNIGTFNDTVIVNAPFVGGIDAVTNAPIPGSGVSYKAGTDGQFGTADDVYDIDSIKQGQSLNFGLNITDANGIATSKAYSYSIDGVAKGSFDTLNLLTASINAQGPGLSIGTHDLVVNVKDTLGNIGTFIDKVTVEAAVKSNLPPDATDDTYYLPLGTSILNLSVLDNDTDPNADPLKITSVGKALAGTVQIINDGTLLKYTTTGDISITETNLISSTDAAGTKVGNGTSSFVSLSADGQIISFESTASDLVANDTNGFKDIFIKDATTGVTELISVATDGTQGNGDSFNASISNDGRYVVFSSNASNLVANDTNGFTDIFLHDRVTGTTQIISNGVGNTASNGANGFARISGDGKFIAYGSLATNLDAGDTNNKSDIFLYDVDNATTERISLGLNAAEANGDSLSGISMSTDGRYIAFRSDASNLVANDNNGQRDIFVYDRVAGSTQRVNISSIGEEANATSSSVSISGDGKFVVFRSDANNLVAGDTNNNADIFVHEIDTGITERISVDSSGNQANGNSFMFNANQSISADGRFVVFQSEATNLVVGDTNASSDVFVHDRLTNVTQRASVASDGTQGFDLSQGVSISADGKYLGFESNANNLISFDNNVTTDIFTRQIITTDSFTYTISDGKGGTDTATVNILPQSASLDAVNDLVVITKGQTVDINILGNDTGSGANLPLVDSIVTGPLRGTISINPNGSINYVPDSSFTSGTDTFVYKMTDGQGNFDDATVTVKIVAALNDTFSVQTGTLLGSKFSPINNDTVIGNTSITSVDGQDLKFGSVIISPNGQDILYTPFGISVSNQSLSPDGNKIAFINSGNVNKNLYIMNSDGTGLVNITQDSTAFNYNLLQQSDISWSPDGTQISFSNNGDIFIASTDGSTPPVNITDGTSIDNKVSLPNSPAVATWSPDGKTIAFTIDTINQRLDNGAKANIQLYGFSYYGETPTFDGQAQGKFAPDLDRSLYTINTETKEVKLLIDSTGVGLDTSLPVWSPDGSKIAFLGSTDVDANALPGSQITASSLGVYIMNADGTGLKNLTANTIDAASEAAITWSPDGTKIAFEDTSQDVWVIDVNSGVTGLTNITPEGITPSIFAAQYNSPFNYTDTHSNTFLTPDKDGLFFAATDGHLYRMNIDGSGLLDITQGNINLNSRFVLEWSPDNTKAFFVDANKDLYMLNMDGTGLVNLTSDPDIEGNFESILWSPDGDNGIFRSNDGKAYIINVDGSGLTSISGSVVTERQSFIWSPDGNKVLFQGNEGGLEYLYTVNADGSGLTNISLGVASKIGDDGNIIGNDFLINRGGTLDYLINTIYNQDTQDEPTLKEVTWSPDGQSVVFAASYGPVVNLGNSNFGSKYEFTDLFKVGADGQNLINLTENIDGVYKVNFAEETNTISFTDKNQNLYLFNYADNAPVEVTNLINSPNVLNYTNFQWSADGKFGAFIDNDNDLYVFQLNGTNSSTWNITGFDNLTDNNIQVSDFRFSPDGQKLIYKEDINTGNPFFGASKLYIANSDSTDGITQLGTSTFNYSNDNANKLLSGITWTDGANPKGFFVAQESGMSVDSLYMIDGSSLVNLTDIGIDVSLPSNGPSVYYNPGSGQTIVPGANFGYTLSSAYALGLEQNTPSPFVVSNDGSQFAFVGTTVDLTNEVGYGISTNIWVINTDGTGLRNLSNEQIITDVGNFTWSPDDQHIIAIGSNQALPTHTSDSGSIFSIRVADSKVSEIASDIFLPTSPGGLPPTFLNNDSIIFQSTNGQLITTDLDGFSGAIKLTNDSIGTNTSDLHSPVWSPDGKTIAFAGNLGHVVYDPNANPYMFLGTTVYTPTEGVVTLNNAIFVVAADGSAPPQIVGVDGTSPAWSMDNGVQTLSFTSGGSLIQLNVEDSLGSINYFSKIDTILNEFTSNASSIQDITWNDQAKVLFTLNNDLYVANQDGTELVNITENFSPSVGEDIFVSPDGTKVVFMTPGSDEYTNNIYEVSSDGSGTIKLVASDMRLRTYTQDPVLAVASNGNVAFLDTTYNPNTGISNANFYLYNGNQLINLTPNGTVDNIGGYASQMEFSVDGKNIVYSDNQNFIRSLNIATGSVTNLASTSSEFTLSPDGSNVFYNTNNGFYSAKIDGSGAHILVSNTALLGGSSENASLSPNGTKVAFGYDKDVYIMNIDGSGLQQVNGLILSQGTPIWSPDGSKLVIEILNSNSNFNSSLGKNDLLVVNADGSDLKIIAANLPSDTFQDSGLSNIQWSPDSSKLLTKNGLIIDASKEYQDIIYEAFQYTITDSYVNTAGAVDNFNTSGSAAALNGNLGNSDITNANKVAFFKEGEIYISNKDGSDLINLTQNLGSVTIAGGLELSPDGSIVTFIDQNGNVNLIDQNGSLQNLTSTFNLADAKEGSLTWLPDGSKFVFIAGTGANAELYTLNADGSNLVNLTGGLTEGGNGVLSVNISTDGEIFFSSFSQASNRVETYMVSDSVGGHSSQSSISRDGRFVAFESSASNLVLGDTNKSTDVFVRDTVTGSIERVSLDSNGNQANGSSSFNSMSTDGRFIVFESSASNLVDGDTNGKTDIFLFDRFTGITERVSDGLGLAEANGDSNWGAISADGRFVAFTSTASNLVAGDTNGVGDIFIYDRQTQTTERISVGLGGTESNGLSPGGISISDDGRFVAFRSDASNLVANDTNNLRDIFVYDRQTQATQRVNLDSAGNQANGYSSAPAISGDGKYVVFWSDANNLDPLDAGSPKDGTGSSVFRHNLATGQTELVTVDVNGNSANGISNALLNAESISEDGRYVAFVSTSDQLTANDTNGKWDLFVRDMLTGTTKLVSNASSGVQSNDDIWGYHLSADGNNVSFATWANNLDGRDLNNINLDVYSHKISTGETKLISDGTNVLNITGNLGTTDLSTSSFTSPDGKYTVYSGTNNELYLISDSGRQLINLTEGQLTTYSGFNFNSLKWSPDSTEFVFQASNGNLYLADAATQELIQVTSGVVVNPGSVVWANEADKIVFVGTIAGNSSLYSFDEINGLDNIGTVANISSATSLQLSPNGSSGSFVLNNNLYAFNTITGGINNITNGVQQLNYYTSKDIALSEDGTQGAFLGYDPNEQQNAQNQVYSVGGASNQLLNQGINSPLGSNDLKVSNLNWSPDGEEAYFTNTTIAVNIYGNSSAQQDLFLYKADGSIINLTPGEITFGQAKWSPAGESLIFTAGIPLDGGNSRTDLLMSTDDGIVTEIVQNYNSYYFSSIKNSPDNNSFLFGNAENRYNSNGQFIGEYNDIYLVKYDGSGITNLTASFTATNGYTHGIANAPSLASQVIWSPDSSKFLLPTFNLTQGGIPTYYTLLVNADGSGVTELQGVPSNVSSVTYTWSPDQDEIAFLTSYSLNNNQEHDIWTIKADGSAPAINITNGTVQGISSFTSSYSNTTGLTTYDMPFDWSNDGDHIFFKANSDLYMANDDGTGLTNLTPGNQIDLSGGYGFSANGSKGFFITNDKDLFTFNQDGTGLTNITNGAIDVNGGASINDTGTKVFFLNTPFQSNNFKTDLYVASTDGSSLTNLTDLNTGNINGWSSPQWSADGSKLFYTQDPTISFSDTQQPVIYDPTTDTTIKIVGDFRFNSGNGTYSPTVFGSYGMYKTPDGSQYFFGDKDSGDIYSMNIDGSNLQNLTNGAIDISSGYDRSLQVSPDGNKVVFRDSTNNLFLMESNGSDIRSITDGLGLSIQSPNVVWSDDGTKGLIVGSNGTTEGIYVFNTAGNLEVTNLASTLQSQVGNLNVGNGGITFSPDGSKVFFAASYGSTRNLFVIDVDGTDLVNLTNDSVRFMGEPDAWGNYASVDNFAAADIYGNYQAIWSSDGSKLAFGATIQGSSVENELYVFDFSSSAMSNVTGGLDYYTGVGNQLRPADPIWGSLRGQAIWSDDNTKLYFVADTDNTGTYFSEKINNDLFVFDTSSKVLTNLTDDIASIGTYVYASADRSDIFFEFNDTTTKTGYNVYEFKVDGSSLTNISKGIIDSSSFTSVSRNLDSIFVVDSKTQDLWNFNSTTDSFTNLTNGLVDVDPNSNINGDSNFKYSPDGSKLTFAANNELFLVNSDGTGLVNITDGSLGVQFSNSYTNSAWSADGDKISFVGTNGVLYSVDADGTNLIAISSGATGTVNNNIEWSPDGKSAIFTTNSPGNQADAAFLYNPDVSPTAIRLSPEGLYTSLYGNVADWSPDGSKIAFYSLEQLFIANSDGTGVTSVTTNGLYPGYVGNSQDASFTWSADGERLFFVADANNKDSNYLADLYMVSKDGTGLTNLSNGSFKVNSELQLDPENGRIVFNATVGNITGLYSIRGDGSNLLELTDGLGTPYKLGINGISANGDSILYNLSSGFNNAIALLVSPTDGSGDTTLISKEYSLYNSSNNTFDGSGGYIASATLSSDGDDVIFIKNNNTAYLAKVSSPESPLELTINPDVINGLKYSLEKGLVEWSADGSSVAFVGIETGQNNSVTVDKLYVMNPTGTLVASYDLPLTEPTNEFVFSGSSGAYNSSGDFVGGYSYVQDGIGPYNAAGNIPVIGYSLVQDGTGPLNATGQLAGGYSLADSGLGGFNSSGEFVGGYDYDGEGNFYQTGTTAGAYDQNGNYVGGYSYEYDGVGQYNQAGVIELGGYSLVNDGTGPYDSSGNNYAGYSFVNNGTGALNSSGEFVGGYSFQPIPLTSYDYNGAYDSSGNLVGGYSLEYDGTGPYDYYGSYVGTGGYEFDGYGPYDSNGNLVGGYYLSYDGSGPYDSSGNFVGGYYDDGNGGYQYDGYSPYDQDGNFVGGYYLYEDGSGPYNSSGEFVGGYYQTSAGGYSLVNTGNTGPYDEYGNYNGGYALSGGSGNPPVLLVSDFEWSNDNSTIRVQGEVSTNGNNSGIQQIYIVDVSGSLVSSDDKATINLSYNPPIPISVG